jgi:hypothetical protein
MTEHQQKVHKGRRHRRSKRGGKAHRKTVVATERPTLQLVTSPAVLTSLRSRLSQLATTQRTA